MTGKAVFGPKKAGFLRELCIRVMFALFQMCVHTVFGEGLVVFAGRQRFSGVVHTQFY